MTDRFVVAVVSILAGGGCASSQGELPRTGGAGTSIGSNASGNAAFDRATHIMGAFSQGAAGNCASIAAIKLALFTYGYEATFAKVGSASAPYELRDGVRVSISEEEVASVKTLAHFVSAEDESAERDPELVDQAIRMLTVMAKNKCEHPADGPSVPCASINSAFDPSVYSLVQDATANLRLLGLKAEVHEEKPPMIKEFSSYQAYVVTNALHAAFGYGAIYDEEATPGYPQLVRRFKSNHSEVISFLWGGRKIDDVITLGGS